MSGSAPEGPSDPPLAAIDGDWRGSARTWFEPGQLTDESTFEATARPAGRRPCAGLR